MKIGFDAKRLFNNATGLGNYSRTLVQNLNQNFPQNEYFLYAPTIQKTKINEYFLNDSHFHKIQSSHFFKSYWRSFSIKNNLQKNGIQLYHGLSHEIPFGIQKTKIKSIVTIHDLIFKRYPKTYSFFDRNIYNFKFQYSCENADKIIAVSENTKKDMIQYYDISPQKIKVIYQACHPIYYQEKKEESIQKNIQKLKLPQDFLLSVGSIVPRKNVLSIIQSYSFLPPDLKIPLVIVGQGEKYKKEIQQYIQKNKLDDLIIFLENVNNELLYALYHQAKIFIYPSLYEGFGIPVLESLLSRTPVITSNVSSLPEVGGKYSYYIDPQKPEEIARGIEKILTDNTYRERMIEEGYKYAQKYFHPKHLSQQLMDVYYDVL